MLRIRRILVPTDFSPCGDSAIAEGVRMARTHGAELHLLHVVTAWRFDSLFQLHDATDREAVQRVLHTRADLQLRERTSDLPMAAEPHVVEGRRHPGSAIVSFAERRGMQLIVMGTHGRGGFRRHLLGNITRDVLRRATSPVLTVRANRPADDEGTGFRSILVPVDFSWCSHLALEYARELARTHGATLRLLHVVSEAACPDVYLLGSQPTMDSRLSMESEAVRRLWKLAEETGAPVRDTEVFVRFGRPAGEVVRFAREAGLDLIVMATHGLSGFLRVMLGSVTSHVVNGAPCSVLAMNWGPSLVPGLRVLSSHYDEITSLPATSGTYPVRADTNTAT
jgi:nucleotide-binding universal stress UspA family protein